MQILNLNPYSDVLGMHKFTPTGKMQLYSNQLDAQCYTVKHLCVNYVHSSSLSSMLHLLKYIN